MFLTRWLSTKAITCQRKHGTNLTSCSHRNGDAFVQNQDVCLVWRWRNKRWLMRPTARRFLYVWMKSPFDACVALQWADSHMKSAAFFLVFNFGGYIFLPSCQVLLLFGHLQSRLFLLLFYLMPVGLYWHFLLFWSTFYTSKFICCIINSKWMK